MQPLDKTRNSIMQLKTLRAFPSKMAILDCETTGGKATRDRITELAIVLVDDGIITEQWQSLMNPETTVPPWITNITGINTTMIMQQPTFAELWPTIEDKLKDRVIVAHNARFDYGFLKNEARRCGASFSAKTLCSVKLSRQLYPQYKHHSLDAIIQRLDCQVENRHRAMDDAMVIFQLFTNMNFEFEDEIIQAACQHLLKRPSLPSHMDEEQVNHIPDSPGVYYFYNKNHRLLYIGKSINLKTRVLSHFYQDHQTSVDHHLSHQLHHIEFDQTPSDFGAQILESQQVKALNPSLNRRLKKTSKLYQYVLQETDHYLIIKIKPAKETQNSNTFGLFRSRHQASKRLANLVEKYMLCHRLSGLEKGSSGSCFAYQLKKCMGACCAKEPAESYNLRVLKAMQNLKQEQWPYKDAILVEEHNPATQLKAFHLVNNWCYLGQIKTDSDLWSWEPMLNQESAALKIEGAQSYFDLDLYFILIRFLLNEEACNKAGLKIHPVTPGTQFHFGD